MEFNHTSVLLNEAINGLSIDSEGIYADGTLGGGGHSQKICEILSQNGTLIGIDRDEDALDAARERLYSYACRRLLVQGNFCGIKEILKNLQIDKIHGAVLDLGVSSFQLDNPERGFSYMQDAPLDMRMDARDKLTAEMVINDYDEQKLFFVIKTYGEEKWAARIVDFIVKERKKKKITRTFELVDIIKAAIPKAARRDGPHPAKRTFQAVRIEVNEELSLLENAVRDFVDILLPGGRLAVITFHSLEDRIVKDVFAECANPCTCPDDIPYCVCGKKPTVKRVNKKPILPAQEELLKNPRSRSAKLRIAERI